MPSNREALASGSSHLNQPSPVAALAVEGLRIFLRRQKVVSELLVAMSSLPSSSSPDLLVVVGLDLLLACLLVSRTGEEARNKSPVVNSCRRVAPPVSTSCVVLPPAGGSTADLLSPPSGPDPRGQKRVKQNLDLQDTPVSP